MRKSFTSTLCVVICTLLATLASAQSGPANTSLLVGAANKDKCADDHKQYCGMKVGLALDLCMKKNYHKLSTKCLDAEFQHFLKHSKNERENPLLKKHCTVDLPKFCGTFKGDAVFCLAKKLGELQKSCREIVELEQRIRRVDIRLNRALFGRCAADIAQNCGSLPNGRSAIWACLNNINVNKASKRLNKVCETALNKENRLGAENALALPGIHANCQSDLKKFCKGVKPGNGRTHACLRSKLSSLSPACKDAEFKELEAESVNIRGKHNLSTACKSDLKEHCNVDLDGTESIDSEKALGCLRDNLKKLDATCKKAEFEELKLEGYSVRLNPWIKKSLRRGNQKNLQRYSSWGRGSNRLFEVPR